MTETVMVEMETDWNKEDEVQELQTQFDSINFVCVVRKHEEQVLVDVTDTNDDVVDLVTEKLNHLGIRAMVWGWDSQKNCII